MAERPVFCPSRKQGRLVEEVSVSFTWHKGMAPSQKKKNVFELHAAAAARGISPLLEVSTKSEEKLGQRLSAFNLRIELDDGGTIPLECAYQGSKVFEMGGPYTDLFTVDSREAKRDSRLVSSGALIGFRFQGQEFPLKPMTNFYDWIYIRAIYPHREFLQRLHQYGGFTDIEFNPGTSINCQARSCATFVTLDRLDLLSECVRSSRRCMEILLPDSLQQPYSDSDRQQTMFG